MRVGSVIVHAAGQSPSFASRNRDSSAHSNGMETTKPTRPQGRTTTEPASPPTTGRRRVTSVNEAAVILGISRAHAYELVARNDLAHVRLGRRILIPVQVLDALLDVTGSSSSVPSESAS